MQRIATSEEYRTSPVLVRGWPFFEQLEAHMTLDALGEVRALYRPDPPKKGA